MRNLKDYVSDQQNIATRISGLADALLCLKDYAKDTAEAEYAVAMMMQELADKLSCNLDTVNLPETAGGAS